MLLLNKMQDYSEKQSMRSCSFGCFGGGAAVKLSFIFFFFSRNF